jgi:imidazoleglycerol-phosphate dehydratase
VPRPYSARPADRDRDRAEARRFREAHVETGIPFFDHLLDSFARHGLFDLRVRAKGDLQVDQHHTVEDVGIVLGQAVRKAVGDGAGLRRFGSGRIPMADARILVDLDLSNRPLSGLPG